MWWKRFSGTTLAWTAFLIGSNFEDIIALHVVFKEELLEAFVGGNGSVEECFITGVTFQ
jgi:hypothetical protein